MDRDEDDVREVDDQEVDDPEKPVSLDAMAEEEDEEVDPFDDIEPDEA